MTGFARAGTVVALAIAASAAAQADTTRFVPLDNLVISGFTPPTEGTALALRHFNREVARMAGRTLPQTWGEVPTSGPVLLVGRRSDLRDVFSNSGWTVETADADLLNQSYVVGTAGDGRTLVAAGFGEGDSPRSHLGLGYALGELLRRLDVRDGQWGFVLPAEAIVETPKMPNRTLYLMNSASWAAPGLSLDYGNPESLEAYVDALVGARYSRISLWQWYHIYLYPGNFDERRGENQLVHRGMRYLFEYARRRGLEVYHQLTPMHVNPDLLPKEAKYTATGYYGRTSICWAQPEGREMARRVARAEMEYYGPVDGYIVWFYDPGGCFCADCRANQGSNLFEQLMLVVELAKTISSEAKFEACLWPTWCFHEEQWGINFPREDVKAFVRLFLDKALAQFGPRNLTIMDSCDVSFPDYEFVIYDGTVKAEAFKRNAFMHRVLGTPGEASYPFSPFGFRYLSETMGLARDRGVEEALFSAIYIGSTFPSVYAFADTLWDESATAQTTMERYAGTVAKGAAYEPFVGVLQALEEMVAATTYADRDAALVRAEQAWSAIEPTGTFYGNPDWMRGYLQAQRRYLEMARAETFEGYRGQYEGFVKDLAGNPVYSGYMKNTMTPELCGKMHVMGYWRGPVGDGRTLGLPDGTEEVKAWIRATTPGKK